VKLALQTPLHVVPCIKLIAVTIIDVQSASIKQEEQNSKEYSYLYTNFFGDNALNILPLIYSLDIGSIEKQQQNQLL